MTSAYEIKNARLEKSANGTYVVTGDTERFGQDEILYESYSADECADWLLENNITIEAHKSGKIQVGNRMYKHLYFDDCTGHVHGMSTNEYDYGDHDLTKILSDVRCIKNSIRVADGHQYRTVKFGNACTW